MIRRTLPALALAALLAGGAAVALGPMVADAQSQQGPQQEPQRSDRAAFDPGRHIEGRIAYLKTELKITDAQQPQFDAVAKAMRDNAKAMHDAFQSLRGDRSQPQTALSRMEARTKFAQLRADGEAKMLAAFRPLYQAMSPDQQKSADEMLGHHDHGHFFRR
ncbi:MAG TPA: Spy/CpxP family protein refolding chaperone [Stellaceae bacterium]|nr:Spy/CpxP family protein refolding chaperone [Stellaceae bacterium]